MDSQDIVTAIALGDFEVALPLLEDMTSEERSHLTLPHDLTPLHYACQHGRVDVAKLLLNNYKYSIERRDVNGCTPLHTAAQYGQLEVFKYLLQILFTNGGTHLQLRVDGKLCHTLMSMYQQTLSERHRDLSGNTPLHTASKHGSVAIVQLLIQEIGCDHKDINNKGMSCLDLAAQHGHLPLVKYLTTQHCDLFWKSSTTSLLLATKSGNLNVVRFFIEEFQCDPDCKDTQEMTLLHHASKHGHLKTVKYLVETKKCDLLCQDGKLTPLHVAASFGHIEVVKYFTIDQYCDPLVKNANNNTPLHLAALKGRQNVIKFFIEDLECDPNSRNTSKKSSLHLASQGGHLNTIKYLVETQKCNLICPDENANTPLHVAASFGHLEVVKYFTIDQHCDPLVKNADNNTPLHLAAQKSRLDMVKFLLEDLKCDHKPCSALSLDSDGVTPFFLAVSKGYHEIVKQMMHTHRIDPYTQPDKSALLSAARENGMLEYFANYVDPLHQAAINGDMDTVRHYIERVQWSPLVQDRHGNSLLHTAAKYGQLEVVKYLTLFLNSNTSGQLEMFSVDQHCDPLVRNAPSNTPLHIAALEGRLDVVKFLIEDLKCDPNIRGELEGIPLHFASKGGHINTIKYLVETQKCDPLCPDEDASCPLHVAALFGHLEVVKYFTIDQHCDPQVENVDNNTPLYLAALEGRLDVVKFLIEDLKCDPNSKGHLKRNPLHFASKGGHLNIIKYLVEIRNCDPLCFDERALTPLHVAALYNKLEVVMYFTLNHNIDPLVQDITNNTPLHLAALKGNIDIAKFFIDILKCDLNCENELKKTPLHLAIENDNNVSKFLVDNKHCNVLSSNSEGVTPFLLAVRMGNHKLVKHMMHIHRIDPYTQPDKKALLSAAKDTGMLEYFANYVDPLHQAAVNGNIDTVRHYIERAQWSPLVQDIDGNSLLHTASKHGQLEVVKYLIDFSHKNTSSPAIYLDFITKNKDGLTAQQLAENKGFMHVVSHLRQASDNQPPVKHLPLPPSVNILVLGNTGSGKSTLVKALSQDKSILGRLTQVKGVQPLTAGIIPTTISSQDFGKVNIYDFAGHEEYYASHEMILHQTTQPLVLIAVNISLPMADIEKQLCYWLSILSNAKNDHAMHVLVIGSHADKTSNFRIQAVEKNARLLAGNEGSIIYHGFVYCDCRYSVSSGMSQLHHTLSEVCTSIRLSLSYSDTSFSNRMCTSLMHYLDSSSPGDKATTITINQLQEKIKSIKTPSPNLERLTDHQLLVETCKSLSANGHLIFLSHETDVGKSLLLIDEKAILSKVHACLGRIQQNIYSLGILEEKQLKEILTSSLKDTIDPSLAVRYLLIAQFCTEVKPDQLTSVPHGVNEQATHYFFPNLVLAERPAQLWTSAEEDKYTHFYTWCLRCSNARHFFTPRYLHILFIQLMKYDTEANAKYTIWKTIWKNGILLVHGNGTRCVIEVVQTTQLFVAIQCVEGHEQNLVKQRSLLISLTRSLVSKICPKLEVDEVLLHPQSSYPPTVTTEIPISAIASSVALGHEFVVVDSPQHVNLSDLLYFDTFHKIRHSTLQDIFINRHSDKPVPYLTMRKVCVAVEICKELLEKFYNESRSNIKEITYQQLYDNLLEFSIFKDEHIQNILAQNEMEEGQSTTTQLELSHPIFNSPLELVDLYEVNVQLVNVTKWKEFGLALRLSRATLEKIEADYHSVMKCLTEVLAALLKGQDRPRNTPLNWKEVIDTLNSTTLDMRDCVETLVQKLKRDKDKNNGVQIARDDASPVDDSLLDSHSLMEVKMSLISLKHKWFHLGLSLGLSYYTLKIIEQSPSEDCLTEVLVKWLDQADMTLTRGSPSWKSLAAVLDCPLVQEHDVARNIKKDHPTNLISL